MTSSGSVFRSIDDTSAPSRVKRRLREPKASFESRFPNEPPPENFYLSTNVLYYTNTVTNEFNSGGDFEGSATIPRNFPNPFINDMENWMCAIERLELSTQAIPFLEISKKFLLVFQVGTRKSSKGDFDPVFKKLFLEYDTGCFYSMEEYLEELNRILYTTLPFSFQNFGQKLRWNTGMRFVQGPKGYIRFYPGNVITGIAGLPQYWPLIDFTGLGRDVLDAMQWDPSAYLNFAGSGGMNPDNITFNSRLIGTTGTFVDQDRIMSNQNLYFQGYYKRYDSGDQFATLRITSNLPLVSDNLGNIRSNIVTDLSIGGTIVVTKEINKSALAGQVNSHLFTTPLGLIPIETPPNPNTGKPFVPLIPLAIPDTNDNIDNRSIHQQAYIQPNESGGQIPFPNFDSHALTTTPRQRIIYAPSRLRWLNFSGQGPIFNIDITAVYVDHYNTERPVKLPPGGSFSIKLAFFRRQPKPPDLL